MATIAGAAGVTSSSNLTLQDFLQVLMTQLTYQDPLKPMDNQEFMAQIAQFTSLQQTQEINASIQGLLASQGAQQSIGLIGRTVGITTAAGALSGTVTAIDLSGATPQLTVKTPTSTLPGISLSQVNSVQ
jgi:flagellar basal-body rod modification protein FlgD